MILYKELIYSKKFKFKIKKLIGKINDFYLIIYLNRFKNLFI